MWWSDTGAILASPISERKQEESRNIQEQIELDLK